MFNFKVFLKHLKRVLRYLNKSKGESLIDDIWIDINMINPVARECLGYPTQKPEALMERIIKASSNKDDLVCDPFCGCGTTIAVAQRLQRKWIGIDVSPSACKLMKNRVEKVGARGTEIIGEPVNIEDLKNYHHLNFKTGALVLWEGQSILKKLVIWVLTDLLL